MKKILRNSGTAIFTAFLVNLLAICQVFGQSTQTFNTSGTFTVPVGVTTIKVQAWGAGAGGGVNIGGGGGGAFAGNNSLSVIPGSTYTVTVGAGSAAGAGAAGGNSSFASLVVAEGGGRGANTSLGGRVANSIGAAGLVWAGGNGASGTGNGGGGGGGSAGAGGAGGNGTNSGNNSGGNGGAAGIAGTGTAGVGGGNGGSSNGSGVTGNAPGAGGGERGNSGSSSGGGGNGRVIITYTSLTYKSQIVSINTGASTWCPGETRNVTVTIKNIGTATWTDANPDINVGVKWNTDVSQTPDSWADYHVRADAGTVAPNATVTYTLSLTASNNAGSGYSTTLSPGTNNITFDLVYEGVSWFGDNGGGVGPGNAKFVSPNSTIASLPQGSLANNTICSGGTGQLVFNATAGTGPFTIVYNDGVANRTATNVGSGVAFNTFANPTVNTNYNLVSVTSITGCARNTGFTDGSATITVNTVANITTQPATQIKCAGQPATFSVVATGSSPTYQWRKNGSNIGGATNASYTIASTTAADAGNYSVVVSVGGCSSVTSANALLTINARPTAIINSPNTLICNGGSATITGTVTASGAWTLSLSSGGTVSGTGNGTFSKAISPSVATTYTVSSLTDANCTSAAGDLSGSTVVSVNPFPSGVTATPASSTICYGSVVNLTGSGTLTGVSALTVDNFNGASSFSSTGSSSGDRSQVWQQELSGANVNSVATFTSPGGGNLMVSTAGSSNVFAASSANSILTSGIISTSGFSSLSTLTFNHTYKDGGSSGTGLVEVSTNGGTSWSTVLTVNSNVGSSSNFTAQSINFSTYANASNLKIRFNFSTANQNFISNVTSWWAIDDVVLNGVRVPLYSWTANTAAGQNGLPIAAGNPSVSNATISVNPIITTEYIVTATNPVTGCLAAATPVTVAVNPPPTLAVMPDISTTTDHDNTGNCSTAYQWAHPSVNTACATTLKVAYTAGLPAPASLPTGGTVVAGSAASATFFTGVTNVSYTATDQNNNTVTRSFTVTVTDNELPTITCPAAVSVSNDNGQCNATLVLAAPATSDNCGVAAVTNDHPSNIFTLGVTEVTWTVRDNSNNIATCIQKVTVLDTQSPTITCSENISVNNDNGLCGAHVTLSAPAAGDNCGIATVTNDHPSDLYTVGTTIVHWTVKDNSGNTASCSQSVTVTDNEKPLITCAAPVTTVTDAAVDYATVTLQQPSVTDNCAVSGTINDHPSALFPIGTTLVTWTATDVNGNTNSCIQTVVVNDTIQPSISCNPPVNINNTLNNCDGATDMNYPAAADNSGHVTVSSDYAGMPLPSIDPISPLLINKVAFPVGTTTIIWTATDPSLNTTWCTQTVTVTDSEKPSITCPANLNRTSDAGLCAAVIILETPVTSDNCGVSGVTNDHPSTTFPVGETLVTWTVTDIHNNINSCTQLVIVTDDESPTIQTVPNVTVNNDQGQCAAIITLTVPSTGDNCGVASVVNDHAGNSFPVGTTFVHWTVTDIHGNSNSITQSVTVNDNELPVLTSSSDVLQTADAGICGAAISISAATATDNCDVSNITGTRNDGLALDANYPVGTTTITWNATDIHNNAAIAVIQTVIVTDNEKPVITASTSINTTSDAGKCGAIVNIVPATATDNCGVGAPSGTRSDGLALDAEYPVGTTTITWLVTDIHNNTAIPVNQTVVITDNEIPVIAAAENIQANNDAEQCGATLSITPLTATDNCAAGATTGTRSDGLTLTDFYPVGTTTITWTAIDIHANAAVPVIQTITITDNELPLIKASADVTQTADAGQCGASIVIIPAITTDNCGVSVSGGSRSDGLGLDATYPVGTTTITWTATDIHGNAAIPVIQTIVITDDELPVLATGDDILKVADQNNCTAAITVTPASASDNCGISGTTGTRSDELALDAPYPVGVTSITWNGTDIHGNHAIALVQTVTVTDQELPLITAAANITVNNDPGKCGALVTIVAATATDNCGAGLVTGTRNDGLALDDAYPVGLTTLSWSVTDIHGNEGIVVTQTVTVVDNEIPVIAAPAAVTTNNDLGKCGARVVIIAPATMDNCGVGAATGTRSDGLDLNALYPVGLTSIVWTVTDIHDNTAIEQTQTITVIDNELPVITTSADINSNNDLGKCGASVVITAPVTTDNCSVGAATGTRSDGLALNALYPVGITSIAWTVTDINGNTAIVKTQIINVKDAEKPVIVACAPSVSVTPNNASCTSILLDYRNKVTATDNCTNPLTLTQVPAAGTPLPLGPNTITITATDAAGNSSGCNFTVTVNKTLDVTITNSNPQLYYGYSLDQSTVIKGMPSGGTAPYKVVVTMNRALGCNTVTSTGDETWSAVSGGTSTGNTCPASGAGAIPVSTISNIAAGGSYSVTATLMANATFTITVTDFYGCTVSKTTKVYSEDARCFAGNSGNAKVKICHRTGSNNEPCHELCVAESAVAAHLAHGDFLGSCTPNCVAPVTPASRQTTAVVFPDELEVNVLPNPTPTYFKVNIKGSNLSPVTVRVIDVYGKVIMLHQNIGAFATLRIGDNWAGGTYFIEVTQDGKKKLVKVIKAR